MHTEKKKTTIKADDLTLSAQGTKANMLEGRIVNIGGGTLVMKTREGREMSLTFAADVDLSCDGAPCQAGDMKSGKRIRVTTRKDDLLKGAKVEAIDRLAVFKRAK